MPVLAWFIFRSLSPHRVRLPVNWVNGEWDSMSTESTQSETPCQLSQRRRHHRFRRFYLSTLTRLMWSLTLRWLSHCGVTLGINSVDGEWDFTSTESSPNVKRLIKSANSRTKSKTLKSLIIWPIYVWSVQKTRTKKSHAVYLSGAVQTVYLTIHITD
jgi:hypothetical protein